MNGLKRIILELFCGEEMRLKWKGGDLSLSFYSVNEAISQLDHFSGYEYVVVVGGFFNGWEIR